MRKIYSIFFIFFLFICSCVDENLNNISNEIEFNSNLALPVLSSISTLEDFLPEDSLLITEQDGLLRVLYFQDSIASFRSDSLFQIENQDPTNESFELGEIDLDNFQEVKQIFLTELAGNLEDTLLSNNFNYGIEYSQQFGSAYFPTISNQSGGTYSQVASEDFLFVNIVNGNLSLEITNNFSVNIDYLRLILKNQIDNSVIGEFIFNNILPNSSTIEYLSLEGTTMYNELVFEVNEIYIYGSGPNPFNTSNFVSMNETDNININVIGSNIKVDNGLVKFPEQEGPSDNFIFDMEFDEGIDINFINMNSGTLEYLISSTFNSNISLLIEIPQLLDHNNFAYNQSINILNTEQLGPLFLSIDLQDYTFDLSNSNNQIEVLYSTQINSSESYEAFDASDFISFSVSVNNLEFNNINGYFGQEIKEIDPGTIDIEISILDDIASNIYLETPKMIFNIDNEISIPFDIDLDLIGYNDSESANLNGPIINILPSSFSYAEYNNSNTNNQLSEFISLVPNQINYSGSVTPNPNGFQGQFNEISPGESIIINFEMNLPLFLRIDDANRTDTISYEPPNLTDNIYDNIHSIIMKLNISNEFPLNADINLKFYNSSNNLIQDSLYSDLVYAAEVDDNGRTIEPNLYTKDINLDSNQIDAFFNSDNVIIDIEMNTSNTENSSVKLYTDYEIFFSLGALININSN
ncbi:MAG: hypothetical protein CBE48_000795 [Flavobacteriales bacterium TMED288]|nr:hypothetical protein [Flavobacteriales bacterium]RPG53711.1 MAG: hypothetical protein CBE48_000795 [Flavobacteriales bacterium TMED288]